MVKIETTLIKCVAGGHTTRVCGKNGSSVDYMRNCPACGSSVIHTEVEILDLSDGDADFYAEEVNVPTD